MLLVDQELLTHPDHQSSPPFFSRVHVVQPLVVCVVLCRSLFVPFPLTIVLSVLLRFTDSNYSSGIIKFFLSKIACWTLLIVFFFYFLFFILLFLWSGKQFLTYTTQFLMYFMLNGDYVSIHIISHRIDSLMPSGDKFLTRKRCKHLLEL